MNLNTELLEILMIMYPEVKFKIQEVTRGSIYPSFGIMVELWMNTKFICSIYSKGYVQCAIRDYRVCENDDERMRYMHYVIAHINRELGYKKMPTIQRKIVTT